MSLDTLRRTPAPGGPFRPQGVPTVPQVAGPITESRVIATCSSMPAPAATRALVVRLRMLKPYGHPVDGSLLTGRHWVAGAFTNSPARWDVEVCPGDRLPVVISVGAGE